MVNQEMVEKFIREIKKRQLTGFGFEVNQLEGSIFQEIFPEITDDEFHQLKSLLRSDERKRIKVGSGYGGVGIFYIVNHS